MPHENYQDDDAEMAIVGILNLQVIVAPEGDSWIAQAIELDYVAAGDNPEDAKQRFESGLCETIQENFKIYGHLNNMLESRAPAEHWWDLVKSTGQTRWRYNQVSLHTFVSPKPFFPFGEIKYLISEAA